MKINPGMHIWYAQNKVWMSLDHLRFGMDRGYLVFDPYPTFWAATTFVGKNSPLTYTCVRIKNIGTLDYKRDVYMLQVGHVRRSVIPFRIQTNDFRKETSWRKYLSNKYIYM